MNKHEHHNRFVPSGGSNIKDSAGNSRLAYLKKRTAALNIFSLLSGINQIVLGLSVIILYLTGFLRPVGASLFLISVAGLATMIGLYLVYINISKSQDSNSLLRKAMQRMMKAKN